MTKVQKQLSPPRSELTKRACVVIADDDPVVLDHVGRLLENSFNVIGRFANGRDLVKAVGELGPAVVITDITMPDMSGIEATRLIASSCPDVRVVVLSIYNDPMIIEAAFEAGAAGY